MKAKRGRTMAYSDESYNLRVETATNNYTVTPAEQEKMDRDLDTLRKLVESFPVSDLKIDIKRPARTENVLVKTSLHLPGRTLFTGDWDVQLHPAYERCIRKLVNKVASYKEKLDNKAIYEKQTQGTLHEVRPMQEPDIEQVRRAAAELDYPAFRRALGVYEEAIQLRCGRWVERYPQAADKLGSDLFISEIVEEVFLNAFERFDQRPAMRLGEWLESLIDPSIQALIADPDEKENLSFIQSALRAEGEAK